MNFSLKKTKKYGLVVPKKSSVFGAEEEEDGLTERQRMNRHIQAAAEKEEKALQADPSVYDYDNAYDALQQERQKQVQIEKQKREDSKKVRVATL